VAHGWDDKDAVDCTRILSDETDVVGIRRGWKQLLWDSGGDMKKCGNKEAYYSNTATAVPPVAIKNLSATFLNLITLTM